MRETGLLDDSPSLGRPELNRDPGGRCDLCVTGGKACDVNEGGRGGAGAEEADDGFSTILPRIILP